MPRRPDPALEEKILNAAQKLWKKGGEQALTMRAVARAAGTNTPAVYRRFRDRDDILRGLLRRVRFEIAAELEQAASAEEACGRYLDYALRHPWEYELFYQRDYELHHSPRSRSRAQSTGRPAREVMTRKLRERFGDSGDDIEPLLTALWMLAHGTAMLLIAKSILPEESSQARKVFTASVRAMLDGRDFIMKINE
jgi:AcrR family transcriptional regulator